MATGTLHDCCRAGSASRSYVLPRLFQQKFATRHPGTIYMVLLFRWPPILEMWHFISANIRVTARSTYPDSTLGCELVGSELETWVDHHTISPLSRPCRHDFQALEGPDFAKSNCLWCTCVAMSLLLIPWTKVSENNSDNSATLAFDLQVHQSMAPDKPRTAASSFLSGCSFVHSPPFKRWKKSPFLRNNPS